MRGRRGRSPWRWPGSRVPVPSALPFAHWETHARAFPRRPVFADPGLSTCCPLSEILFHGHSLPSPSHRRTPLPSPLRHRVPAALSAGLAVSGVGSDGRPQPLPSEPRRPAGLNPAHAFIAALHCGWAVAASAQRTLGCPFLTMGGSPSRITKGIPLCYKQQRFPSVAAPLPDAFRHGCLA